VIGTGVAFEPPGTSGGKPLVLRSSASFTTLRNCPGVSAMSLLQLVR
jgi:hypothetical protein